MRYMKQRGQCLRIIAMKGYRAIDPLGESVLWVKHRFPGLTEQLHDFRGYFENDFPARLIGAFFAAYDDLGVPFWVKDSLKCIHLAALAYDEVEGNFCNTSQFAKGNVLKQEPDEKEQLKALGYQNPLPI